MNAKKRLVKVVAALSVAASALALSACSGTASTQSSAGSKPSGTITYGIWDDTFRPAYEKILTQFKKKYPDVNVKFQVTAYNDYFTKLQTEISSKTEPDVYWLQNNSFELYSKNNVLAPLDDGLKTNGVSISQYPSATVDQFKQGGKLYAMPWSAITVGLWYNKDLFKAAGLSYPTSSWTWSDVQNAAAKLTSKSKGIYGITAPIYGQEGFYNTIYQAGGSVIDGGKATVNSAAAVKGIDFWAQFAQKGESPTVQQLTDTTPDAWFQSGKVGMYYGGSWHSGTFAANSAIADKIDVAPLPAGESNTVGLATAVNVVAADSKQMAAAQAWTSFLATDQAQKIQAASGIVVPADPNAKEAWEASIPKFHVGVFVDQVSHAKALPSSLNTPAWEAYLAPTLAPLWSGTQSAQTAANTLNSKIQSELDSEK